MPAKDETPEYQRWTVGVYYGEGRRGRVNRKRADGEELRLLFTYEWVTEDGDAKDDRAIAWV